jgi:hypothetical protein
MKLIHRDDSVQENLMPLMPLDAKVVVALVVVAVVLLAAVELLLAAMVMVNHYSIYG